MFVFVLFLFGNVRDVEAEPVPYAFENVIKTDTVDLSTGDMGLSLPLFTVPGRSGLDYPIVLNYKAGIKMDQQASWVGLGWNLDVDSVSRQIDTIPDDYTPDGGAGSSYKYKTNYPSTYPSGEFRKQWSNFNKEKRKAQQAVNEAKFSTLRGFATSNPLSFLETIAQYGMITFPRMDWLKREGDLKVYQEAVKNKIDKESVVFQSEDFVGSIYGYREGTDDYLIDRPHPDNYLVSSSVYSGPLILMRSSRESSDQFFIPPIFSGYVNTYYGDSGGNQEDIDLPDGYNDAPITSTSSKFLALIDTFSGGQLDGFKVVAPGGYRYLFDSVVEEHVSATLDHVFTSPAMGVNGYVDFSWTNAFPGDILGTETPAKYHEDANGLLGASSVVTTPYTSRWGITSITTPDYIDLGTPGFGGDDKGSWVKFTYYSPEDEGRPLSDGAYTVSNSGRASDNDGTYFSFDEDYDVTPSGQKFISRSNLKYKFIKEIETPTHVAVFNVGFDRYDGWEAFVNSGELFDRYPKLNSTVLYRKTGSGRIPVERYVFDYDYSLAYAAPDNPQELILGDCEFYMGYENCGRLTLKELTYEACSDYTGENCNSWNSLPPFVFEYGEGDAPVTEGVCEGGGDCYGYNRVSECVVRGCNINEDLFYTDNPRYVRGAHDLWGFPFYYKTATGVWDPGVHNEKQYGIDYYSDFFGNIKVDSWSLSRVDWPNGGYTRWYYEPDSYSYVNDQYIGDDYFADAKYGGGIRVKYIVNCDGFEGNCLKSSYLYTTRPISQITSHLNPGVDSSGVSLGEPSYPVYSGEYAQIVDNREEEKILDMIDGYNPSVIYSRVLVYDQYPILFDDFERGVSEHFFTTPLDYPAEGEYVPDKMFSMYTFGESEGKGSPVNPSEYYVGLDTPIGAKADAEELNTLYATIGEPYLALTNEPGYLFFTKGSLSCAGYPSWNLFPFHPVDEVPYIGEDCPGYSEPCGVGGPCCGEIVLEESFEEDSYDRYLGCGEDPNDPYYHSRHGNIVVFCPESAIVAEMDDFLNGGGIPQDWRADVAVLGLGSFSSTQEDGIMHWDLMEWYDECYHVYGGHADWDSNEYWHFAEDVYESYETGFARGCYDGNSDKECDLLEYDIPLGKEVKPYKYGINDLTNIYSGDDLYNPMSYSEKDYSFLEQEFVSSNFFAGTSRVIGESNMLDGLVKESTILEWDTDTGIPLKVEEQNSDGVVRRTEKILAKDVYVGEMDIRHLWTQEYATQIFEQGNEVPVYEFTTHWSDNWVGNGFFEDSPTGRQISGHGNWYPSRTEITDQDSPDNLVSKNLAYDKYGNLVVSEDGEGNQVYYTYGDNTNQCGNEDVLNGLFIGSSELKGSALTCVENDVGHQVKTHYNELYLVDQIMDANQETTSYDYDGYNRLESVTPPGEGSPVTEYSYNYGLDGGCGGLESNPSEGDPCMNWVQVNTRMDDKVAKSRTYTDGLGRHIKSKSMKDDSTAVAVDTFYTSRGLVDYITEPYEESIGLWRIIAGKVFPNLKGEEIVLGYREGGSEEGVKYFYYNDPLARVEKVFPLTVYNLGDENYDCGDGAICTQTGYSGMVDYAYVSVTDAEGNTVAQKFDKFGNLVEVEDALGNTVEYQYDVLGRLLKTYDQEERLSGSTVYNTLGQVERDWDIDSYLSEYTYDLNGNVETIVTPNGDTIKNYYDDLNRVDRIEVFARWSEDLGEPRSWLEVLDYTYDSCVNGVGRVCRVDDGIYGTSMVYSYDEKGRVTGTSETLNYQEGSETFSTSYGYDSAGNVISVTYDNSGDVIEYEYNLLGQLDYVTFGVENAIVYDYNALGQLENETYYENFVNLDNPGTQTYFKDYSYNERDWISEIDVSFDEEITVFNEKYTGYDNVGNLKEMEDGSNSVRFNYDDVYRLLSFVDYSYYDDVGIEWVIYDIDDIGNRLSRSVSGQNDYVDSTTYVYEEGTSRLESTYGDEECTYDYDDVGNMIRKDCDGEVTRYWYNLFNNMITRIDLSDGQYLEFEYDALNRRVKKYSSYDHSTTYYSYGLGINPLQEEKVFSENLVMNPSFEDDLGGDEFPDNWATGGIGGQFIWDSENPYSGEKSVKISRDSEGQSYFFQYIEIQNDTLYEVSGYVRADNLVGDSYGTIVAECANEEHETIHNCGGTGDDVTSSDWQFLKFYFFEESGAVDYLKLSCYHTPHGGYGIGDIWCDNMNVRKILEMPPVDEPECEGLVPRKDCDANGGESEEIMCSPCEFNHHGECVRADKIFDFDDNLDVDITDFAKFAACYNLGTNTDDENCLNNGDPVRMDADGSCIIGIEDLAALSSAF